MISDDDFTKRLEYLIKQDILKLDLSKVKISLHEKLWIGLHDRKAKKNESYHVRITIFKNSK
jgi:hypothetical protein